jgi:uncharacterized phage infection (PIP) family protein YhgE
METTNYISNVPEKHSNAGKWIVGGVLGAMIIANGVLFSKVHTLQDDLATQRSTVQTQFTELRDVTASSATAMNKGFEDLTAQLQEGTRTASAAGQRAAATALSNAQKNAEKLVAQLQEQQAASDAKFAQEIGAVKTVTDEHTAKVSGLETSVGSVKENVGAVEKEVASTRSTLDQTISDLKSARGDLGVQSGLIATNAKELAALRDLGERNYYEFTLEKGKAPVKVANMVMTFKNADTKRNKYNVEIMADDKRIEKKDKTVNEPVQMYVGGNRQPYEIVVNQVKKNTIVGYVAVPKVLRAAR